MADETLTIALDGDIALDDFTETMKRFGLLVDALSKEIAGATKVEWRIEELAAGSAITTIRGISNEPEVLESIARAFVTVGKALQHEEAIPYSNLVKQRARRLAQSIKGSIESIRFETRFSDALLVRAVAGKIRPDLIYSYGQISGTVQTLQRRRGLKFMLYDPIFDKPTSCYLHEDQEEAMRGAWGRQAIISGEIGRDPSHWRPVVVRDIQDVQIIEDVAPGSYRLARGVLPSDPNDPKSEVIIRGIRDEW